MLIEEFSYAFKLDYIINRCGVISGPLQFGKEDQGFVSLWVWHHIIKSNLILKQINNFKKINNKLFTVGGSNKSYTSLRDLTLVCEKITGNKIIFSKKIKTSIYDIPYFISNNRLVSKTYKWSPKKNINIITSDIYQWIKQDYKQIKKYLK